MLLLAMALVCALCVANSTTASAAATIDPSTLFKITETAVASTSSSPSASLKFTKQISVSSNVDGAIAAVAALTTNLPGQVFISYAPKASKGSSAQLGEINVYASSEALASSVSAVTKRAMTGAKLAVSSSTRNLTAGTEFLLTEIVLLKKTALKKLITNGAGDVVVGNNVLFTKSKSDYPRAGKSRALRAAADRTMTGVTIERHGDIQDALYKSNWMLYPSDVDSVSGTIPLNVEVVGAESVALHRIDTDRLPDGAIGQVIARSGAMNASVVPASAVGASDTVRLETNESSNAAVPYLAVLYLAPYVSLKNVTSNLLYANRNVTILDASLLVVHNGTGNLIVSAADSAIYTDKFDFFLYGTGILQAKFAVLYGNHSYSSNVRVQSLSGFVDFHGEVLEFTVLPKKICFTSRKYGLQTGTYAEATDTDSDIHVPCPVLRRKVRYI